MVAQTSLNVTLYVQCLSCCVRTVIDVVHDCVVREMFGTNGKEVVIGGGTECCTREYGKKLTMKVRRNSRHRHQDVPAVGFEFKADLNDMDMFNEWKRGDCQKKL